MWVQSLVLLSGSGIQSYSELWCRSQTQLGSGIAVAVARPAGVALIQPLAWEHPYATSLALKKKKKLSTNQKKILKTRLRLCLCDATRKANHHLVCDKPMITSQMSR